MLFLFLTRQISFKSDVIYYSINKHIFYANFLSKNLKFKHVFDDIVINF